MLCCSFLVHAQSRFDGIPYIRNFSRQDYNSSPFNWSVVQDKRGVIYVANNYHILEFDGNSWKALPLPNRTVIRSLAIDTKGTVYVGGQADFGYLQPDARGEVAFVSLKSKIDPKHHTFADVWRILVTEQGIAFCTSAGIYYLHNDRIAFIPTAHEELGLTSYFYISQRLFVCTERKGIFELRNGELVLVPESEGISSYNITAMLPFPGNRILLVTQKHGLFLYDGYSTFSPWQFEGQEFLTNNVLVCAAAISKGYVLGSSHDGVLMITKEGNLLLHINKEKGLQNNGVEYIFPDHNGNLWLALRDGVDYIEINSPFTIFNGKSGIAGAGFTSFMEGDRMYLGTSEGLYFLDQKNDSPSLNSHFTLIPGSEGQTYNLQKVDGELYLTHNNGLFRVKGTSLERVGTQTGAWLFFPVRTHPGYYICGSYTGMFLYKSEGGKLRFLWKIKGFDESSRVMEQDDEGNIWVAHGYLGLFRIRLSDDLAKAEKVDFYNSAHGFPSNVFINVFKVNNQIVFAGERGIYTFNHEKNAFIPDELFNSLINKNSHTRKLIEDNEGNIWFSSGDEIGVLKKRSGQNYEVTKTIFNKLQRRLVGGFEHIAYYDERNVLIGTDDGFVHFDPSFNFNSDQTFATLLRRVEITSEKDSLLSAGWFSLYGDPRAQPEDSIPSLPYSMNGLRFTFSATSYEDAPKVQYQYKLEGYDANWSAWSGFTSKEYTNLKEGDYTFMVKSRDIYNREGSIASYSFTVRPPWYRTAWAYLLYSILVMAALYMVNRIAKYEQQKRMKLKEIQHQEEVLRAEKEIIKLNNEKLENELSHKNKELASSAMHIVHNAETIQKIRNSLVTALEAVQDNEAKTQIKKVLRSISNETTLENNWEQFEHHFNQIHQDFLIRLRKEYPDLTHSDIKLISYLKLNLSTKEIAPLLNLSVRGVEASRYRIRKKMNLSPSVNLTEYILKY
jgi:ligand-binding sensor domain-containing protein/DNA-binding CsgD family transcriptional regulator